MAYDATPRYDIIAIGRAMNGQPTRGVLELARPPPRIVKMFNVPLFSPGPLCSLTPAHIYRCCSRCQNRSPRDRDHFVTDMVSKFYFDEIIPINLRDNRKTCPGHPES